MTSATSDRRSSRLVIRAARVNDDFIDAEIREYRRREDELRQQTLTAAAAARASTSSADVTPNSAGAAAIPGKKDPGGQRPAWTTSTRAVVRPSRSVVERRQTEVTTTMLRRWASLRLRRELLYERQRELELLQQGRIDTTSDQRRITLI